MKKVLPLLFVLILCGINPNFALAEGDLWDNFGDSNFYGNDKAVSEKEFQDAINSKKGIKNKKPSKKQGETIQQSNETEVINQIQTELPVITVSSPIKLSAGAILPVGHYQVVGEKKNNQVFLKLYQGHYLIASLPAVETLEDYDMPDINFANFISEDDNHFKIIYGSIDFNAYVQIESAESDNNSWNY